MHSEVVLGALPVSVFALTEVAGMMWVVAKIAWVSKIAPKTKRREKGADKRAGSTGKKKRGEKGRKHVFGYFWQKKRWKKTVEIWAFEKQRRHIPPRSKHRFGGLFCFNMGANVISLGAGRAQKKPMSARTTFFYKCLWYLQNVVVSASV